MSSRVRINSVGEEDYDAICIDGDGHSEEYEIDNTFLASIKDMHPGNDLSRRECHCHGGVVKDANERYDQFVNVTKNHFEHVLNEPIVSTGNPGIHIILPFPRLRLHCVEPTILDKQREYSGEHRPKVQRQSSRELRELRTKFDTLDIDQDQDQVSEVLISQDDDGDTILILAIISQYTNLALMLTNLTPSLNGLNSINNLFQTALHLAVITNNVTIVRRLVVAGADVTVRDRHGNTALHIACSKGFIGVAKSLLEPVRYPETKSNTYQIPFQKIPQNLELRNAQGLTCLLISAAHCDRPMMDLLITKYANINAYDMKNGKTCLHMFSEVGNLDMVKYMLSKAGLNLNQRTFSSFTAAEIASYRGHCSIVSYLLYHGCEPDIRSITSGEFDADLSDSECLDDEIEYVRRK